MKTTLNLLKSKETQTIYTMQDWVRKSTQPKNTCTYYNKVYQNTFIKI
jgi:hypothetical protein